MKKITFLIFLLVSFSVLSQELNTKEIGKIRSLEVDVMKLNLKESNTQKNMRIILNLDKKRRINKRWAIGFSIASALVIGTGIKIMNSGKNSNAIDGGYGDIFGGLLVASGALPAIASIPFWISTHKRKKERDRMLLKYQ